MKALSKFIAVTLLACAMALAAPQMAQAGPMPPSFADLVDKLSPAVVNVSTTQKVKSAQGMLGMPFEDLPDTPEFEPFRQFFEQFGQQQGGREVEREVYSLGSGFIIDPQGYIVTNNHVIDDAEDVEVTLPDHSKYKAKIIGRDTKTDLALLKVDTKKPLPFVPLGDSDAMRPGDWVIAIGNPYGLGGTVTQGIISARQRSLNAGPFDDFLQTDAPINRGNSGGPLFNEKGEVIGINTAIFSPSGGSIGIGFAIPTALAKPVIDQLREFGRTHRGWLGVKIQEVTPEVAQSVGLPKAQGALVIESSKDGPAAKAGIQAGDVITQYDGKDIVEMRFLPRMVAETKAGQSVPVTIWRNGSAKTMQVTIGKLEENEEETASNAGAQKSKAKKNAQSETVAGMDVAPLTSILREQLSIDEKTQGLAVVDVKDDSDAAKNGVRPGDVITEVNNVPVKTIGELKKALDSARQSGRAYALARIVRGKDVAFVPLPTGEGKK